MIDQEVKPWEVVDTRGYTILHIAALENSLNLVQFFIDYCRDAYSSLSD
jgi:hypothetical protein